MKKIKKNQVYDFNDPQTFDGHMHVIPIDSKKEHLESMACWCDPLLHYKDEFTLIEVWAHKSDDEVLN